MKAAARLDRLEKRNPAGVRIIMVWTDDDIVTDDDGTEMTAAEWRRRHPEARHIVMTWGDDDREATP